MSGGEIPDTRDERDDVLTGLRHELREVDVRLSPLAPLDGVRHRTIARRYGDTIAGRQVADAPEDGRADVDIVDVTGEDSVGTRFTGIPAHARPVREVVPDRVPGADWIPHLTVRADRARIHACIDADRGDRELHAGGFSGTRPRA